MCVDSSSACYKFAAIQSPQRVIFRDSTHPFGQTFSSLFQTSDFVIGNKK